MNLAQKTLKPANQSVYSSPFIQSKNNDYLKFLTNQIQQNQVALALIQQNQTIFSNWTSRDSAEFFSNYKTTISNYKIIKQIGKGCFGKVYVAKQNLTDCLVALKAIPLVNIQNKSSSSKIQKEVRILQKVNSHQNVVRLFEVFQDAKYVYIVSEYVNRGDLVRYFKENSLLEEAPLQDFILKILRGVEFLHSQGIIH